MASPFRLARVNVSLLFTTLLLAITCSSLCTVGNAFSVAPRQTFTVSQVVSRARAGPVAVFRPTTATTSLFSSQDDDTDADADASASSSSSSRPKRRVRRRKEESNEVVTPEDAAPEVAAPPAAPDAGLRPREAAKPMQVRDIRDLVPGGRRASSSTETPSEPEEADMASSSSPQPAPTKSMYVSAGAGSNSENTGNLEDSLKMLLLDARKMQDDKDTERQDAIESGTFDDSTDDETSFKKKVRSTIGTIIAADFFVVCAFLVWFLIGIAARSVADNDTIQIAFNNNFQLLVQPAIGILMVGSVAGAIFPEKEEEY
jgi:hypothetical protein